MASVFWGVVLLIASSSDDKIECLHPYYLVRDIPREHL
ncbi:hypothetical protein M595_3179 [Lyngbya aestuarii BL J]|uniref:Uncharacterized protein n=1 Tax=Lyngbya aestuarii BL J TaxID=1348334 RepID=U7QIE1_9CYAN|nr:hypothetical protein M595_3179 [Lyngbya aestuarii BL J]